MQCQKVSFQGGSSAVRFRLSPEVCELISKNTRLTLDEMRYLSLEEARELMIKRGAMKPRSPYMTKEDVKRCVEFSRMHPDLAPRNVYLRAGRVMTKEEIDEQIAKLFKEPLYVRVVNWFKSKFSKN